MPRPKRDELMRHERIIADDEPAADVFVNYHEEETLPPPRDTAVVLKEGKPGKGRRALEDMLAAMPNDPARSVYALERIAAAEDQIVKILELCPPKAREMVLEQRPSLRRYAPEES